MKSAKEYRMEAKEALKGNWGLAIGISIVFALISSACGVTLVGVIVLGGAITCGYIFTMMNLIRNKELLFDNLFEGFRKPSFSATIGYNVKTAIFTFLWALIYLIPAIIVVVLGIVLYNPMLVIVLYALLPLLIPATIATYRYSMAPYILMDHPEMTGGEAIKASKELMKGKKWKLFCLELSFIGWILLSIPTLGILLLWIEPWMLAAQTAFYESIKDEVPGNVAPSSEAVETV